MLLVDGVLTVLMRLPVIVSPLLCRNSESAALKVSPVLVVGQYVGLYVDMIRVGGTKLIEFLIRSLIFTQI